MSSWTITRNVASSGYFKTVPKTSNDDRHSKVRSSGLVYRTCSRYFSQCDFTDESKFQFYRVKRKRWVKFGRSEKWYRNSPTPSVTVWGGISKLGMTPVIFIPGNIDSVEYCEIPQEGPLKSVIRSNSEGFPSYSIQFCLQRDSATHHVYILENCLIEIKWPQCLSQLHYRTCALLKMCGRS